ncbi:MAG TPA: hypothetical protein VNL14_06540 [Candidatus Acidoferrales bacterium]|nr:hypothetical protein [Candidatus Acidoferrales bacterium]
MQASLFDDEAAHPKTLRASGADTALTGRQKILLLALNFIPLAHVTITLALLVFSPGNWFTRALLALAALYLLPPAIAYLVRTRWKIPEGRIAVGSTPFFAWWALFQLQMIFCRLPALEEALRLVPGAYSAWLRLWGARIGRLTFWAPGTFVLDRPFVEIGNDVVFGAGVRINPHVVVKSSAGKFELLLGAVRLGDGAQVGGYSLLTAGAEIAPNESTDARLLLPPFCSFKGGKRIRARERE